MPISCGALNKDNPENMDDDSEKEDQIEDGGGEGGKRGVLYCRSLIKVKFSTDQVRLL